MATSAREERSHPARWSLAVVLVVIGCVLTPVALAGTWARRQVLDVDRFVETTSPLARDPAVRAAVSDRLTVEVEALIDRYLAGLVPTSLVEMVSVAAVESSQFESVWDDVMRLAHPQLRNVLFGDADEAFVGSEDGKVAVDLRAAAALAVSRFFGNRGELPGLGSPGDGDGSWELVVFQSEDLVHIQWASRLGNRIVVPLAFVAGIALVAALIVAPDRDKTLKWIGIGWLIGAVAVGLALAFGRARYVAVLDTQVPEAVAKRTFDILVETFLDRVRILFVVGLVVTTVGVLLSPWRAARAGERRERGSALSWLRGHRGDVAWTVLAAGLGVLVWWPEPTLRVTASVAGLAVVAGLAAALVGPGARPAPAT